MCLTSCTIPSLHDISASARQLFPVNLFTVAQLSIYLDGVTEGVAEILKEM